MVLKTLRLVDKIGSLLLNNRVPGERPTTLRSDSFDLTLEWLPSSKLSGARIKSALSEVALPSGKALFGTKAEKTRSVGAQVRKRRRRKERYAETWRDAEMHRLLVTFSFGISVPKSKLISFL